MNYRLFTSVVIPTLAILLGLAAPCALAESVQEAEEKLANLAAHNQELQAQLTDLETQLTNVSKIRDKANHELIDKKADLIQVSQKLNRAIAQNDTSPSAETRRLVEDLNRSQALSEKIVSRRQLELRRAQRRYEAVLSTIGEIQTEGQQTSAHIQWQRNRIEQLKLEASIEAVEKGRRAQQQQRLERQAQAAETRKSQRQEQTIDSASQTTAAQKPIVNSPAINTEKPVAASSRTQNAAIVDHKNSEPLPATPQEQTEEPAPTPTLEEQLEAINDASDEIFTTGW